MAKRVKTIVLLTDDLTGQELAEGEGQSFVYSFDGVEYEIDLSDQNAEEFRKMMSRITSASRRTDGKRSVAKKVTPEISNATKAIQSGESLTARRAAATEKRKEIRKWARENGYPMQSDTGKIMDEVFNAWDTAHPDDLSPRPGSVT